MFKRPETALNGFDLLNNSTDRFIFGNHFFNPVQLTFEPMELRDLGPLFRPRGFFIFWI